MSYEEEETNVIVGNEVNVRVVGISIPMWDKVMLLVGFAIAAIPAFIILISIGVLSTFLYTEFLT